MTLKEFIAENGDKKIEIQEDGTIRVLEDKGPWKPKRGESYYAVSDIGKVVGFYWWNDEFDKRKLKIGNVFQTEEEANRALHRLKARKKFLDAGGHEGLEEYEQTDGLCLGVFPHISGTLVTNNLEGISAFSIWFESEDDVLKAINSLTDNEKAALCWTGDGE